MHRSEDTGPRRRRSPKGGRHGRRAESERPAPAEPPVSGDYVDEGPMYVFTRAQAREVDRLCVSEFGIPSIVLMENAALGLATVARDMVADLNDPGVLVLCGPGNNGGDGLATARHLANEGLRVGVVIASRPENYAGDAAVNLNIAQRMGLAIEVADSVAAVDRALERLRTADLVVDALLGTGIDRPPSGVIADLIERCNALHAAGSRIMAVDVPSGLDADTGLPISPGGPVVRAHITVALLGVKVGYLTLAAQEFLGDCLVAGIGAPRSLIERLGRVLPDEGAGDGGGRSK